MPPPPLRYNDTSFALPSFRLLSFFNRPLADPEMKAAALAVFDLFVGAASGRLAWFAKAGSGVRQTPPQRVDDAVIAAERQWLEKAVFDWPTTFRFNGWLDEPDCIVAPPHLRIEQRADLSLIQMEMPPDLPAPAGFADRFCAILGRLPLVWGVIGMGIYLPTANDSLVWMLPRVGTRFRAAIEVQPDHAERGLRTRRADLGVPARRSGIPDIGWRTLLGSPFISSLDFGRLQALPGVDLHRHKGFIALTAGPVPIWGDINQGEDLTSYRAVAAALRSLRLPPAYIRNALFGSGGASEKLDRLEAWSARYED